MPIGDRGEAVLAAVPDGLGEHVEGDGRGDGDVGRVGLDQREVLVVHHLNTQNAGITRAVSECKKDYCQKRTYQFSTNTEAWCHNNNNNNNNNNNSTKLRIDSIYTTICSMYIDPAYLPKVAINQPLANIFPPNVVQLPAVYVAIKLVAVCVGNTYMQRL